jgi:glycerophosphoryl diester phosphodiesterase
MDESSDIGGASMVVAPNGEILADMGSRVGLAVVDIDPAKKYYKPAGFGNPDAAHYEYIEKGRRPWKYRPAGSAIVRHDAFMPYPRTCAHRGFNTVAPENSLPAFGAAVAMGAQEIEFDLWFTKDGEVVSIHDPTLDRVSNGSGNVWEYTLSELRELDFGSVRGEAFSALKIPTFEDILKKFSCHCIMNIHLKTGKDRPECLKKVVDLIHKYDCEKYVYFMSGDDELLELLQEKYPNISRCCGGGKAKWEIVERAIKYGCKRVQLFKPCFNQEMIDRAHEHGIICNVFWSDDPEETQRFLDMGIDVILTNDYHRISSVVDKKEKYIKY